MENETITTQETQTTDETLTTDVQTPDATDDSEPSLEKLTAELEAERAANKAERAAAKKNKEALDKALKEVARLTKENRANKTEAEIEAENKRVEAEKMREELEELRIYRRKNDAKERYLLQGMTTEHAIEAAEAEVAGDMDKLADIQRQHTESLIKAKEAEWKLSRPRVNAGDGSVSMTKEEIMAIQDPVARREAIARNIDQF